MHTTFDVVNWGVKKYVQGNKEINRMQHEVGYFGDKRLKKTAS